MCRRVPLHLALLCAAVPSAQAQADFPSQPTRLVVPSTPGGGTDAVTRLIADKIQQIHKSWTLVVDNRPGAGGNIVMDQVAKARAESAVRSLDGLVSAAKAAPGQLPQALAGSGTVGSLAGDLWARQAGVRLTSVPRKGVAPALQHLMGGQTDLMFDTPQAVLKRLNAAVERTLGETATPAQLLAEGSAPMRGVPDEVARYVKAEHARRGAAVNAANLRAN